MMRSLLCPGRIAGFLVPFLMTTFVVAAPAAAADGSLHGPAPSQTRTGAPKATGVPLDPQPTGRLIVRYRDGTTDARREQVRTAEGLQLVAKLGLPGVEVVKSTERQSVQVMERLGRSADVVYVEPEYRRSRMAGPTNEPLFGQQWSLHNTGQSVGGFAGAADVDMNVPEAWAVTTGGADLVVAVIDDGVDLSHPDLAARRWVNPGEIAGNGIDDDGNGHVDDVNGWDFCNDDATVHDADDFHGTHVAGTIAASGNGAGIAGVAPNVRIMAVKFLGDDPGCGTDSQAAAAIHYAISHGADIINASWGGAGYSRTLETAIADAPEVLVVAAAGNSDSNNDDFPVYPASFELGNVLSVAAIHNAGHLTGATNYGPSSVDLSAPGEDILSTLPGGGYGLRSGTSMAAANATGVAALAASARPSLLGSGGELRLHLMHTARALPTTLGWVLSPRLLDARAAVTSRPDVTRLSGVDRYATAAAISRATFVPHVPYLFVATARSFPDALAGGALAAQLGSPLLLVSTSSIPAVTLNEVERLKPIHIYVLGGPAAISEAVLQQLRSYDDPIDGRTVRLAGADRYATAAAISRAAFEPRVETAFIATGANFPDALAGAPAAGALPGPLLLVTATSIPSSTATELGRLEPQRIVILGGTAVVSSNVAAQLDVYTPGPVRRWSGPDRFATAASVAAQAFPSAATVFVASGLGFPDALAGGPSAGAALGPLLLVGNATLPSATQQQILRLKPVRIFVLGGTAVVSGSVVNEVKALFP